ncbi:MAG: VacJ family lipoprotein [Halieaceae bacterium]|jgi:phospholipid-binding lipoprotein MlaA|nr:VacJ family lipoprotein [Halieaceae bacterium]
MTATTRCLVLVAALLLQCGCATAQTADEPVNRDPFEGFNRAIFVFNDNVDRWALAPVARTYKFIMPSFAERGVSNFFANLYDLNGALNAVLQGRFRNAAQNSGRFVVNSTVGMFGFVDVASEMGIAPYRTDFGHTLAIWGVSSGPYLMVPFLGPRTVRSGMGTAFDTVASLQWQINDNVTRNWLFAVEIVDNRAALTAAEDLITGDRYIFIRDAYLQQREYFVNGGVVEDSFSDFEEEFDWEE